MNAFSPEFSRGRRLAAFVAASAAAALMPVLVYGWFALGSLEEFGGAGGALNFLLLAVVALPFGFGVGVFCSSIAASMYRRNRSSRRRLFLVPVRAGAWALLLPAGVGLLWAVGSPLVPSLETGLLFSGGMVLLFWLPFTVSWYTLLPPAVRPVP